MSEQQVHISVHYTVTKAYAQILIKILRWHFPFLLKYTKCHMSSILIEVLFEGNFNNKAKTLQQFPFI